MTKLLLAIAMLCLHAASAHAQTPVYPAKPVRIIVAAAAGGPYDEAARAIGPRLTEIWGQAVIVDNRPGAANIIGGVARRLQALKVLAQRNPLALVRRREALSV